MKYILIALLGLGMVETGFIIGYGLSGTGVVTFNLVLGGIATIMYAWGKFLYDHV